MKKYAMIGCGGIGQYHLNHLLQFQDIEAVAFCDLIPDRAAAFAKQAGGEVYTDYRELLDKSRPDMLFICIPPYAHGDIEMDVIKQGIPFFVEKPVSLDLNLAKRIRDEIARAGLITAVGFQCRYSSLNPPTRTFVEQNEISFVQCSRIGGVPEVSWWRNKTLSGGQIVEQTIHQFDLIRFVFGEPVNVFSMNARGFVRDVEDYDTDDLSVTVVRFANGALASISTGCYAQDGAAFDSKLTFSSRKSRLDHYLLQRVDIYGIDQAITKDSGLVVKGDGTMAAAAASANSVDDNGQAGLTCDRTFVEAVISGDGSKILSPYADAVKTLAFTLGCNQSIETGQPVDMTKLLAD